MAQRTGAESEGARKATDAPIRLLKVGKRTGSRKSARTLTLSLAALVFARFIPFAIAGPEPLPTAAEFKTVVLPSPVSDVTVELNGVSAIPRRLHYALKFTIRGVYDDNIDISHSDRIHDYYFAIEPGITLGYGDIYRREGNYLRLDYQPSIFLFIDHDENDAVQHLLHLEGFHEFSRLSLNLKQDITILKGADVDLTTSGSTTGQTANIDVGGRTALNVFGTRLGASYDLSSKTFLSGQIEHTLYDYEDDLISSEILSGGIYINYNYSPKLVIGIGGNGGYNWVDSPTPDQTFEQANVRLSYQATGKISLNASAGVEFRQFGDHGRGDYVSPVYELSATYQPFDGTMISGTGSRRTLNSAVLDGQDFAATNITMSVRQRLFRRIYLGLTAGYENADYLNAIEGVSATRRDNYYFVDLAVDFTIARFWSLGCYYLHRQDFSSFENFSFYDNQIGARMSLTF